MKKLSRAERRRLKREKGKENKTYNLSVKDIKNIEDAAISEASQIAFKLMLGIPILILRDKYGFGKKRLTDFINYALDHYDSYEKDYFDIEDIEKVIYEEVGIKIK